MVKELIEVGLPGEAEIDFFLIKVDVCNLKFCRYFLSIAYVASLFPGMHFLQRLSSFSNICSTLVLRTTNALLAVICSILIYEIITHLKPSLDDKKSTLQAVILSLYPLHWFFTFLYYTDVASLTAVIAMYLLVLKRKYMFGSLVRDDMECILFVSSG